MFFPKQPRLSIFVISIIVCCVLSLSVRPSLVRAYDDASEISHSHLNQENFLDIKSYQFHKLKEEEWYESQAGWRLTGGSMGLDLLFTDLEILLPYSLGREVIVYFKARQEEFYEIKPFRYLVEVEWRATELIGLSLLGMPEYDKRKADQGGSITLGKGPWNYIKFQQLLKDLYYNEKNFYDTSYYSPHPVENNFEGMFSWKNWKGRFTFVQDTPFKLTFPARDLTVNYKSQDKTVMLDYHFKEQEIAGFSWRSFDIRKRREKTNPSESSSPDNRGQQLLFSSTDLYWLHPLNSEFHGTIGLREDRFQNIFRQLDVPFDDYNFYLWTLQVYGIIRHKTAIDRFFEYALYAGDTEKVTNYLSDVRADISTRKPEVKMRISWDFLDLSNQSALMFTSSWNLDNFSKDFWDGGNISYQKTF
ncbi:MAG: hypothetical protein CL935_03735 [Deltaproteobacteria bacterium]|nr:hypothetical protein [Deltaproteobacteria bacterium]|tara:strand:- start:872 stop:2125 length:1254 start_codon:yes stop_codon:yes gene_type:complete